MPLFVNVSCANIYREPTFHSEIDTQAVLWEKLQYRSRQNDFIQIITEDGYGGWINRYQVADTADISRDDTRLITAPEGDFYENKTIDSRTKRDGFAGIRFPVTRQNAGWLKTQFPDGAEGWIEEKHCQPMPALSRRNIVEFALRFMGRPYFWGGKTPKGMDCSGFVQLIHKMFAINLPRDAWMQHETGKMVTKDPLRGQPGDLMFFAEKGDRITHVGFCLGNGKLLHARGMVGINSLNKDDADFSEQLQADFVEIKTFFKR